MKKTLLISAFLVLASAFGLAQTYSGINGDCMLGGQQALTQGLPSTGTQEIGTSTVSFGAGVQASFPNCLVTVYISGTTTKAPIFSNQLPSPQPLVNPFTANSDGSFTFFGFPGTCYDIQMSTGIGPQMPYTRTLSSVCQGLLTGGSGGGGPVLRVNGINNVVQAILNLTNSNGISPVDNGDGSVSFRIPVGSFSSGCLTQAGASGADAELDCIPGASYNPAFTALQSSFVTPVNGVYRWQGSTSGAGQIGSKPSAGSPVLQWPTQNGTLLNTATSPLVADGNGNVSCPSCGTGSGGGNPNLDNCTPDQTGNSYYSALSLVTAPWFYGHWEFILNTTSYFTCTAFIPSAQNGATFVVDVASSDAVAGHTANFQTCDNIITTGTFQVAPLTCAAAQAYTTTATAYQRVSLTFNVQSTLVNNGILVVKIAVAPTGTAPTGNLLVYPHFVL